MMNRIRFKKAVAYLLVMVIACGSPLSALAMTPQDIECVLCGLEGMGVKVADPGAFRRGLSRNMHISVGDTLELSMQPAGRALFTSLDTIAGDTAGIRAQLTTAEGQRDTARGRVAGVEAERNAATQRVTVLTAERDLRLQERNTVQARLTTAEGTITTAQARVAALTAERDLRLQERDAATQRVATLTTDLGNLTGERDAARDALAPLRADLLKAQAGLGREQAEVTRLKAVETRLKTELDDANRELAAVTLARDGFDADVKRLTAEALVKTADITRLTQEKTDAEARATQAALDQSAAEKAMALANTAKADAEAAAVLAEQKATQAGVDKAAAETRATQAALDQAAAKKAQLAAEDLQQDAIRAKEAETVAKELAETIARDAEAATALAEQKATKAGVDKAAADTARLDAEKEMALANTAKADAKAATALAEQKATQAGVDKVAAEKIMRDAKAATALAKKARLAAENLQQQAVLAKNAADLKAVDALEQARLANEEKDLAAAELQNKAAALATSTREKEDLATKLNLAEKGLLNKGTALAALDVRVASLDLKRTEQENLIKISQEKIAVGEAATADLEGRLTIATDKLSETETKLATSQETLRLSKAQVDKLERDATAAVAKLATAETQIADLEAELDNLRKEKAGALARIATLEQDASLHAAELNALQGTHATLRADLNILRSEYDEQHAQHQTETEQHTKDLTAGEKLREAMENDIQAKILELAAEIKEANRLSAEKAMDAETEKTAALRLERELAGKKIAALQATIEEKEKALKELQLALDAEKEEVARQAKALEDDARARDVIKQQIEIQVKKIETHVQNIQDVSKKRDEAHALSTVLTLAQEELQDQIKALKNQADRASVVSAAKQTELEEQIALLDCGRVTALDKARADEEHIATLTAEHATLLATNESLAQQLEDLHEALEVEEAAREDTEAQWKQAQTQIAILQEQRARDEEALVEHVQKEAEFKGELENANARVRALKVRTETLQTAQMQAKEQQAALQQELVVSKRAHADAESRLKKAFEGMLKKDASLQSLAQEMQAATEILTTTQAQILEQTEAIAMHEANAKADADKLEQLKVDKGTALFDLQRVQKDHQASQLREENLKIELAAGATSLRFAAAAFKKSELESMKLIRGMKAVFEGHVHRLLRTQTKALATAMSSPVNLTLELVLEGIVDFLGKAHSGKVSPSHAKTLLGDLESAMASVKDADISTEPGSDEQDAPALQNLRAELAKMMPSSPKAVIWGDTTTPVVTPAGSPARTPRMPLRSLNQTRSAHSTPVKAFLTPRFAQTPGTAAVQNRRSTHSWLSEQRALHAGREIAREAVQFRAWQALPDQESA